MFVGLGVGVADAVCPAANGVELANVYELKSLLDTLVSIFVKLALAP